MNETNLSISGGIVIIDDNDKECVPLIKAFGKNSIPYLYYNGDYETLPDNHISGVRFVFLDIVLAGMDGQPPKMQASTIIACLSKIIAKTNGPYAIIFWTKHQEIIDNVLENCQIKGIPPAAWIDLEKKDYINNNGCDLSLLSKKLKEKLSSAASVFCLYIEWENILHSAGVDFIYQLSRLVPPGNGWADDTSKLFYKLYESYRLQKIDDASKQFQCACSLMNRSFFDTLQQLTDSKLTLPDNFKLTNGEVKPETVAKLNTSLFIITSPALKTSVGYVYLEKNEDIEKILKESMKDNIFKKNQTSPALCVCKIIITPSCDLACEKILKVQTCGKETKIYRVVYALMIDDSEKLSSIRNKNDAQFEIGPFWHEEKIKRLILHFSTISLWFEDQISEKPLFALSRDLLFDIQSKAANHVNRLGNFQLQPSR